MRLILWTSSSKLVRYAETGTVHCSKFYFIFCSEHILLLTLLINFVIILSPFSAHWVHQFFSRSAISQINKKSSFSVAVAVTAVLPSFQVFSEGAPLKIFCPSDPSIQLSCLRSDCIIIYPVRWLLMQSSNEHVSAIPEHEIRTAIIFVLIE